MEMAVTSGLRMSPERFAELQARSKVGGASPAPIAKAHGRRQQSQDGMNKTEEAYSRHLELRRMAGEISDWKFHALKLRLAKATFFDTDFLVTLPTGELEIHEVKGHMEDDAAVKLKVAAEMFPFRFVLVRRDGQGWSFKEHTR